MRANPIGISLDRDPKLVPLRRIQRDAAELVGRVWEIDFIGNQIRGESVHRQTRKLRGGGRIVVIVLICRNSQTKRDQAERALLDPEIALATVAVDITVAA